MARKAILDTYYSFTPSTRTIVIPRPIPKERLVLITDVTTNQVLFNFSDPNLTTTAYTIGPDTTGNYSQATTTTITLNYNTTALSATDKLQIVVDEYDEKFSPSESYLDPINKLRVSTPQSLIDTDYEYSIQTTKWEQLSMINNRPFAYYVTATGSLGVSDITATYGSKTYVANVALGSTAPPVGNVIVVADSVYGGADGIYTVDTNNNLTLTNTNNTQNNFSYTGKFYYINPAGSIYNNGTTIVYNGTLFSNAAITLSSANASSNVVNVTTSVPHGLVVGNEIALVGASAANGSWTAATVSSPTTFTYLTTGVQNNNQGALTLTNASLYVRPQGLAVHRAFDGGVRFSTNAASHNQQYIRQTRRYFRYQSGKGIQMSTGTTLKPQFNLDGLYYNSSNNSVTVTTKDPHNIAGGLGISISGANETAFNGNFTINNVINPYQFTYTPNTAPSVAQASGTYYGAANAWYGAANRIGIFDSQNGIFWEYDGQGLFAVRRNSIYQLSGQISVTPGSATVTASTNFPTFFSKQVSVNDYVVIKGMSYRVTNISSDSSLTINPPYRGLIASPVTVISKTVDLRIPSSQFNIDRLDGTGPSGYNIDLTKMQMFYIDYSWYGAGFIRWGVRGPDGNVIYCHKLINNNVNYLAYMRSGNLPGRYETNTFSKTTFLLGGTGGIGSNLNPTDQTIYVGSTSGFPSSGTLLVRNTSNTEYINYSSISGNTFVLSSTSLRGQAGNTTGQITGSWTAGNNYITGLSSTTGSQISQYLYGSGIPSQSYITSIPNSTTIVMSQSAFTTNVSNSIIFAPLANVAQTFTYSATAQTAVELHSPIFGPEVNHWGTSAIMDGGFTPDKSFIFTKGMTNNIVVPNGSQYAVMSFRISPTASNGVPGVALGYREIINRMQQLPFEVDAYANGSFLITCYLNARTSNTAEQWQSVGGSSLSQYIFHTQGTTVTANTGEPVFGFYLNNPQGTYATTQQDLTQLLALGNSINGGGNANAASGIYPDGPDVLTFAAQNIDTASRGIQARYSWNEAQA